MTLIEAEAHVDDLGPAPQAAECLSQLIKDRAAGPGNASFRCTACIARTWLRAGAPSTRILTRVPSRMSLSTICKGIWPQPKPALRKACLAPISASRHVFVDSTPKFR